MSTTSPRTQRPGNHQRLVGLLLFSGLLIGFGFFKAFQVGYFEPRIPLSLEGKPVLVFFTLQRGCECQMSVVRAGEAQLESWNVPVETGVSLLRVDFNRRPDLAKEYDIIRAPALLLLDEQGQVVWKQDLGLSDAAPLDLAAVESHLFEIGAYPR